MIFCCLEWKVESCLKHSVLYVQCYLLAWCHRLLEHGDWDWLLSGDMVLRRLLQELALKRRYVMCCFLLNAVMCYMSVWLCAALLVGSSLPSSLSMMPVAAAGATPSQLGFAIGPPGNICRVMLCISTPYAVARCLSRLYIRSKRMNISLKYCHHRVL